MSILLSPPLLNQEIVDASCPSRYLDGLGLCLWMCWGYGLGVRAYPRPLSPLFSHLPSPNRIYSISPLLYSHYFRLSSPLSSTPSLIFPPPYFLTPRPLITSLTLLSLLSRSRSPPLSPLSFSLPLHCQILQAPLNCYLFFLIILFVIKNRDCEYSIW